MHEKLSGGFQVGDFMFHTIFDYGEHDIKNEDLSGQDAQHIYVSDEIFHPQNTWPSRQDPFSSYRSGFEIRTYRRCERVLMFHNFPKFSQPILVRSTDLSFSKNPYNNISFLQKVTQRGYRRLTDGQLHRSEEAYLGELGIISDQYGIKSFPPVEFTYSSFEPDKQRFKPMSAQEGDMPARALTDPNYSLVDLFGTGLPDVVFTSPAGFFYWKNKGNGQFDSKRTMKEVPNGIRLSDPGVGFGDMAGNGQADLLVHAGNQWGFFEADGKAGWKHFSYYKDQPSFDISDPQTRMFDLDGSGKSGALTTTSASLQYFPCNGEAGFDSPIHIRRRNDLQEFPDIDFSDPRVKLADMTGDGLK